MLKADMSAENVSKCEGLVEDKRKSSHPLRGTTEQNRWECISPSVPAHLFETHSFARTSHNVSMLVLHKFYFSEKLCEINTRLVRDKDAWDMH
jgi:hypothetical protein